MKHKITVQWQGGPRAEEIECAKAGCLCLEGERSVSFVQGGLDAAQAIAQMLWRAGAITRQSTMNGAEFTILMPNYFGVSVVSVQF